MQKTAQPQFRTHDLRKQISQLLNFQYKTTQFSHEHTFPQLIAICEKALRKNINQVLYQVACPDMWKYGMKLEWCEEDPFEKDPFEKEERILLGELAEVCERIIEDPQYKHIDVVNKYVIEGKLQGLKLTKFYKRFQLNFRYVNLKQALVYSALSQCNVWYTICKSRKKSKKQFDLDPLIEYFNNFTTRLKMQNPYHIDILPKKQVKSITKKTDQQKKANPLFQAVSNGDHDLAKELLLKGAKIEAISFLNARQRMQVRSAHRACLYGDLKMCKLLDSFSCNWQGEDSQKMTPIFYAIQSASMPLIKYLVQQLKVNIQKQDIQSRTPFYWASTQGDIDIIDYFYRSGCNINHKSQLGRTALSKSCYLGRRDIVMYLLKLKEIDMYSQCKKGRTALHNAVFGPKGGREGHKFGTNEKDSPECAQILLENGMDVDMLDFQQCTALHVAMSSEAIDSIRLLTAYGASLTAKNNYQQTPLMTGAKFGHVEACRILYQQYHADILCVDIYNKNLLLLTAKFQQNSQDGNINPVYIYFLQPFIQQCLKYNKIQQLHRTFKEIVNSQFCEKMVLELVLLWNGFKKFEVPLPEFGISQVQSILKISIGQSKNLNPHEPKPQKNLQPQKCRQFAIDVFRSITLSQQKLKQIHIWLIKYNQLKILEFLHEHELLHLNQIKLSGEQFMQLLQNDELGIKEKVVSFCLLSVGFDWVGYRSKDNANILHVLVRKQRSGCIVQLFKALAGKIPQKILTNCYIKNSTPQQHKKILQQLLWEKDQSGLDAHQLSLILKNKSVAKLIEQKLKQQHLQFSSVLDIKQYVPILETDPKQLQIFNNYQHEKEDILAKFEQKVTNMNGNEVMAWWDFRKHISTTLKQLKQQKTHNITHQQFWKQIQTRPLHFINSTQQLHLLTQLSQQPVIGIDIQYFSNQGITMISLFQLSSLKVDYIIDCLNVQLREIRNYLEPILYDQRILKIMHGADNDLVLVKSLFNLSVINFVDTSRLDVQIRQNKYDLRGLATLARQYLNTTMSKQYQVSQWRIRPLPKAMLQYAKKDSMILPFLLADMLDRIKDDVERIRQFILSGCKQVRRNKKVSQPLIKGLKVL